MFFFYVLQGFFTGTYNAIGGKVKHQTETIGDISGKWNEEMDYKNAKVRICPCFERSVV